MKPEHSAIEDLEHQLRGPLSQAIARLNSILRDESLSPFLVQKVIAVRGLCHKAKRVAVTTKLFALLDSPEPKINLQLKKLRYNDLIKMLVESAQDNELLIPPHRRIRIIIDQDSFKTIHELPVDPDLFEQALNNLLDNAAKYSFKETTISVSAQRKNSQIKVTVMNQGIPIRAEEVSQCLTRGWRGDDAQMVTGEGSGLGLWVVDNIMKAHNGLVQVWPTDNNGLTQVNLIFPVTKES